MSIQASALFEEFRAAGLLHEMTGADTVIEGVSSGESCGRRNLVFVDREAFIRPALEGGAAAVITSPELAPAFSNAPDLAVLTSPNVKLARALVTQRHFERDLRAEGPPGIHPSAVIAESAQVAASARIGPHVYVGREARVGEECVLSAGVIVEEGATIGTRSILHPAVVVGHECEIGSDVIICAGTVVGSEGFGFAQDEKRRNFRIPHLGKVVVEDRVVIGANCCIDRGSHGATRIGSGTIMDNLCHVAHNVEFGNDCILTAMLCVAGSTRIGNRVVTSGQVGIIDHLDIADDVFLVHRAGVATDIKTPGAYGGVPLQPLKEHVKSQASIRRLGSLRDAVRQLEKRIAALEAEGEAE